MQIGDAATYSIGSPLKRIGPSTGTNLAHRGNRLQSLTTMGLANFSGKGLSSGQMGQTNHQQRQPQKFDQDGPLGGARKSIPLK